MKKRNEDMIRTVGDLGRLFLGGETDPRLFNKRLHKGTDCGAWISVLPKAPSLRGEKGWIHNGDTGWRKLRENTVLETVMVGTIVEGSDATFEEAFDCPVSLNDLNEWVETMDQEAHRAWERDNLTWVTVSREEEEMLTGQNGEYVRVVRSWGATFTFGWDELKWRGEPCGDREMTGFLEKLVGSLGDPVHEDGFEYTFLYQGKTWKIRTGYDPSL